MRRTKVHCAGMKQHSIIEKIDAYAEATGLSRTTICERATGNTRLYDRLVKRQKHDAEIAARVEAYIEAHPPKGNACNKSGHSSASIQGASE